MVAGCGEWQRTILSGFELGQLVELGSGPAITGQRFYFDEHPDEDPDEDPDEGLDEGLDDEDLDGDLDGNLA